MKAQPVEDLVMAQTPGPETPAAAPAPVRQDKDNRLAAYMTHELRAPLTSVRSALSLLQMQLAPSLEPEQRQILDIALKNSERLDGLINDIMDFSKVRAGKMEVQTGPAHPEQLMQEAVESLRAWAVAKGVRLVRAESDEPLPMVHADAKRTLQVLVNLLSNAIKFTPSGGRVELSAAPGRHEHMGTIVFKVKDTGPGIPHEDLDRIFRCFEQSALGVKTAGGTGLGLTLAKAMVELQGGRIWAESWKGLGATFAFTLPILQSDTSRKVKIYPKPLEYHGLLVGAIRRLNSIVAALFA